MALDNEVIVLDIYRLDLEFSDNDKIEVDKVLSTIELNDVSLPEWDRKIYEIGDKEINLSEHWLLRNTSQQGSMIIKQFQYAPLSIIFSVMWHESGSKQTEEEVLHYFEYAAKAEDLFETTIGGEDGYDYIHYDYVENDINFYGIAICTTGGIYNTFILSTENELKLDDEVYHNYVKMFEENVNRK